MKADQTDAVSTPAEAPVAEPAPEPMPLGLFQNAVAGQAPIELVRVFFAREQAAGRMQDTHANYLARFDAFANAPAE